MEIVKLNWKLFHVNIKELTSKVTKATRVGYFTGSKEDNEKKLQIV